MLPGYKGAHYTPKLKTGLRILPPPSKKAGSKKGEQLNQQINKTLATGNEKRNPQGLFPSLKQKPQPNSALGVNKRYLEVPGDKGGLHNTRDSQIDFNQYNSNMMRNDADLMPDGELAALYAIG